VTPSVVGVYYGPGDATKQQHWKVVVRDNLAYLAAGNGGIQIVDVSNPASPTMVSQYLSQGTIDGHVDSVELDGNVLRTGQQEFEPPFCSSPPSPGYYNYDVSNPLAITPILGSHGCVGVLKRLATKGGVTFSGLGGGGNSTICLDTSNPTGPVGVAVQPWGGDDMEVHGNYLYVVNSRSDLPGLSVVDVTDPFLPTRLSFWLQPNAGSNTTRGVGVSGNRAFLGYNGGVHVLDISNPALPTPIAQSTDIGGASDVIAEGNLCYSTYFGTASSNPAECFLIRRLVELPVCGTADFNGDGDFGTDADIEAFFACLAGNCCANCYSGGSDFNADGDFGTDADIESFFRVLAGGPC
jgi:hypothetical protein